MEKLKELKSWVDDKLREIEADDRFQAKPAPVQVNAPLALVQVELRTYYLVLKKIQKKLEELEAD